VHSKRCPDENDPVKEDPPHVSLSSQIKLNFRERKIKDPNLEFCRVESVIVKLKLSLQTVFLRLTEVGGNIARSDIDGVGNTLLQGNRSFKVN